MMKNCTLKWRMHEILMGTEKPLPELYKLLNIILLWEMPLRNFMREMKTNEKN